MIGILIVDIIGVFLFGWVISLIRKGRLYVGYGSALLITIGAIICVASVPAFTYRIGSVVSGTLLVFFAIYCILFALIYVFREITMISRRLRTLTQQLAIELARRGGVLDSGEPLSKTQYETENAAPLSRSRGA
ncbi:MAG TPA: DUF2304 domain-containing protein [Bryobacteraceae bacterium]